MSDRPRKRPVPPRRPHSVNPRLQWARRPMYGSDEPASSNVRTAIDPNRYPIAYEEMTRRLGLQRLQSDALTRVGVRTSAGNLTFLGSTAYTEIMRRGTLADVDRLSPLKASRYLEMQAEPRLRYLHNRSAHEKSLSNADLVARSFDAMSRMIGNPGHAAFDLGHEIGRRIDRRTTRDRSTLERSAKAREPEDIMSSWQRRTRTGVVTVVRSPTQMAQLIAARGQRNR